MQVTYGKIAATVVWVVFGVLFFVLPRWGPALNPVFTLAGLFLIWWAEYAGEFVGAIPSASSVVTQKAGSLAVTVCGWAMLLGIPVLLAMIHATPLDPP